jgi:hypothetical protein
VISGSFQTAAKRLGRRGSESGRLGLNRQKLGGVSESDLPGVTLSQRRARRRCRRGRVSASRGVTVGLGRPGETRADLGRLASNATVIKPVTVGG